MPRDRGFTLLEIALAMAVALAIAAAATPVLVRQVQLDRIEQTAKEVLQIADAAKSYYLDRGGWPGSVMALKTWGYLPASFTERNPWGNLYRLGTAGSRLSLTTSVPQDLSQALASRLPFARVAGAPPTTVTSEMPVPGQSSDLTGVNRRVDDIISGVTKVGRSAWADRTGSVDFVDTLRGRDPNWEPGSAPPPQAGRRTITQICPSGKYVAGLRTTTNTQCVGWYMGTCTGYAVVTVGVEPYCARP